MNLLDVAPLDAIDRVTFYKRDEVTTDLICCDILVGEKVVFSHEEQPEWPALIAHLEQLPGFDREWFAAVAKPAFQACPTVAFDKHRGKDA